MLGQVNFWIGLFLYLLLLPFIIHRVFKVKNMPDPTLPLITIIAAPGSLLLTGYLKAFPEPQAWLVVPLLILSQVLYWFIITRIVKLITLPFLPKLRGLHLPLGDFGDGDYSSQPLLECCWLQHGVVDRSCGD